MHEDDFDPQALAAEIESDPLVINVARFIGWLVVAFILVAFAWFGTHTV